MRAWLFRLSTKHLWEHPGRSLLGLLGIALGTAVYLSISLAAVSALRSFQDGVSAVAGKAEWRLMSPGAPLADFLFTRVRQASEVKAAAPVIESILDLSDPHQGPVLLLGLDPFSELPFRSYEFLSAGQVGARVWEDFLTRPDGVLMSEPLAQRLSVKPGDTLPVMVGSSRRVLTVVGLFRSSHGLYPLDGSVLLMDLAHAQELLGKLGQIDYIDLLLKSKSPGVAEKLAAQLPPGVDLVQPGSQGLQMEGLVAAYRLNLSVLSGIALFVGMFLIYQSVTLSVVRRRREIGLCRTLGMTPGQVLVIFLAEGVVNGLAGGLLGLFLGVFLAKNALGVMTQTMSSLYTPVAATDLFIQTPLLVKAWVLAIGATLVAAWLPAREAARTPVRAVWYREDLEERLANKVGQFFWFGLGALMLAGMLASVKIGNSPPYPGFAAAFLILLSFALLTPAAVKWWGRTLAPWGRRLWGVSGELGCRYLAGSLSRSAVSIAALGCALGMLIAVAVMIGSFRRTVDDWVSRAISGDIFFGPAVFSTAAYDRFLPSEVIPELQADPQISDIYFYRCVRIPFRDRFILVIGGSFEVLARHGSLWFRQGEGQELMLKARSRGQVMVSEPLAEIFGYREGDLLILPTPSGPQRLTIAGIFYDYRTDGPSVWMDITLFRQFWQDRHLNAVRLYLKDPSRVKEVQAKLQHRYGQRYHLLTLSHADLRAGILKIFDDTFALTYALEGVAIVVAVFGIITTFLVLIMERERDLALLQAIGTSRRRILGMVLVESGLASLLSFVLGALSGSLLSLLLIFIINKQAFGWTVRLYFTPGIYWQTLVLVTLLGLAAGAYPAWRALQSHLAAILKEE